MPLYEYSCRDCGHRFDTRQSIHDEPLSVCPKCNGTIRRVIQPVGIVFKGSGFYKTDSRSSSEASVPPAERKSETPAASSGEGSAAKSDSAPTSTGTAASSGDSTPATKPTGS